MHASTSDKHDSDDGIVTWRLRSSRAKLPLSPSRRSRLPHHRRARSSQLSSHSHRPPSSVHLTAPSLSSCTNSLSQDPNHFLVQVPRRSTVVKFTNDIQAKVELRKRSSQNTLHVSLEENKFGSLNFNFVPRRRISVRAEGLQSWLGLSRARFFPSLPRIFNKRPHTQAPSYAEALTISSDGRVTPIPFTGADEQQWSWPQNVPAGNSTITPLCMRMDAEYSYKDRRWALYTGVEGERKELSAKLVTRPFRVTPRFRVPVSGSQNRGWVQWTLGDPWFLGEVEFGWRNFTLAHAWPRKLRFTSALPNGSGLTLHFDKRMVKTDGTYIFKVLKSRFSLAVITTVANKKQLNSASLSLSNSLGSLSAYVKQDYSYGLALESDFSLKARSYHVAFKTDNLKSLSMRLGLFY